MKLNDRVWFTGNAQWLHDSGYTDSESTWLLHCYGIIDQESTYGVRVSFEVFCVEGYEPCRVWVPKSLLKFADLSPEYIEESENP